MPLHPQSLGAAAGTDVDQARSLPSEPRETRSDDQRDKAPPFIDVPLGTILAELNRNLGRMHASAANARSEGRSAEAARIEAAIAAMDIDIARLSKR